MRRDLERLNNMRNNLYAVIGNEEKALKDKESEKNKLITQKSLRLNDIAEKEKLLSEKESKNEDLRKLVETQKLKVKKANGGGANLMPTNEEEHKKS